MMSMKGSVKSLSFCSVLCCPFPSSHVTYSPASAMLLSSASPQSYLLALPFPPCPPHPPQSHISQCIPTCTLLPPQPYRQILTKSVLVLPCLPTSLSLSPSHIYASILRTPYPGLERALMPWAGTSAA
jgi:hypothetical protein